MTPFAMTAKRPNGTVLTLGVSYPGADPPDPDATRGVTPPKVFTYAALKTNGRWYLTGSGKTPQDASWSAVERWLARDGRRLEWVREMTMSAPLWSRDGSSPSPD